MTSYRLRWLSLVGQFFAVGVNIYSAHTATTFIGIVGSSLIVLGLGFVTVATWRAYTNSIQRDLKQRALLRLTDAEQYKRIYESEI